jgi:hypothetical protein
MGLVFPLVCSSMVNEVYCYGSGTTGPSDCPPAVACYGIKTMKSLLPQFAVSRVIFSLLLAILCVGCKKDLLSSLRIPTETPAIRIDQLQFESTITKQQYSSLSQCIDNLVDTNWKTLPYEIYGNFVRSSWCRGTGTGTDCQIGGSTDRHDQHIFRLFTFTYQQSFPAVFGLGFEALWAPADAGWCAHFTFSENGKGILADHWGVIFKKYGLPSEPIETTIHIWSYYQYTILETQVFHSSGLPLRDDLALYLETPEAMRNRFLEHIQALAQKVETAINTHSVETCDYGPYLGDGIPPECTLRPLAVEEEEEELIKANEYFSDQERIMNDNYREMYGVWMKAFPMDQCWPH